MEGLNQKFTNIIKVYLPKKYLNTQKSLSIIGQNVKAHCALIANVIISCT